MKLQRKFVGPFYITERIGNHAYRLASPTHWRIHDVFHISLLKAWHESSFVQVPSKLEVPEIEKIVAEPQYEIERILHTRNKRICNRTIHKYYILWSGYPIEEVSWIIAAEFDDLSGLQRQLAQHNTSEE